MKKKILVVENSPTQAYSIKVILEGHGFDVVLAFDGLDGYGKAKTVLPDLIIMDVMMPKLTGYEACEKIKGERVTAHIPVIIFTERSRKITEQASMRFGADFFTSKENFVVDGKLNPDMLCCINSLIAGEKGQCHE